MDLTVKLVTRTRLHGTFEFTESEITRVLHTYVQSTFTRGKKKEMRNSMYILLRLKENKRK